MTNPEIRGAVRKLRQEAGEPIEVQAAFVALPAPVTWEFRSQVDHEAVVRFARAQWPQQYKAALQRLAAQHKQKDER